MHFLNQSNWVISPHYAISEFLFGTQHSQVQYFAVAMLNITMHFKIQPNWVISSF